MHSKRELAILLQGAMARKNLTREDVGKAFKVSSTMLDKILCGDVVPSKHLEKQMVEVLNIPETRVRRVVAARRGRETTKLVREEKTRKAA